MRRWELWLGLAVALVLRLGFTVHAYHKDVQPTPTGIYDYEPISRGLLASGVYSDPPGGVPTARREPGYILFVALVYKVFAEHRMYVFLVQVLLSTLTAGILYGLASRLWGPVVARFSFWTCVFYPYFIYYSGYFFREDWLAFLLVCFLYVLHRWKSTAAALGAGALAGWLCLSNGAWAVALGAMAAGLAAAEGGAKGLKRGAAFLAPVVLFVGVWAARNWVQFHEFIPFSTNVGGEIYVGMTIPYETLGSAEQTRILSADAPFQAASAMDEIPRHKALMRLSKEFILKNPVLFAGRMIQHGLNIWRPLPHDRAYTHSYWVVALAALGSDGWLLPLALFGFWVKRRDAWAKWLFAPAILLVSAAFSISQAPIRYRVPLMIPVILLAGAGAERLLDSRRKKRA